MNNCTFIGRLTKEPAIRYTKENHAVCTFSIAVNRNKDIADFFAVRTWNATAENCARYLTKGSLVAVNGSMQNDSWEKDGQRHNITYLNAYTVKFLERKTKEEPQNVEQVRQDINRKLGIDAKWDAVQDDDIPF